MAVLEIKKYPDKVLSEKTAPVNEFDSELQKLIDDMIETMYAAPGIGLAANQVGVSKRVAVIDVNATDEKSSLFVLVHLYCNAESTQPMTDLAHRQQTYLTRKTPPVELLTVQVGIHIC